MAQLKDLLVTGAARFLGDIYGNLKGTADKAIADKNDNDIAGTYATNATVSNAIKEITLTNNDTLTYKTIGNVQKALTFLDATYDEKTGKTAHGLMSATDKAKLDGIASGANKITIDAAMNGTSTNPVQNKVVTGKINTVETTAKNGFNAVSVTTNTTSNTIGFKNANSTESTFAGTATINSATTELAGLMSATDKAKLDNAATLDDNGKVPASQLPSYVDDVLEYNGSGSFPKKGESGKIYVDIATNLTYRWSGSGYVEISPSVALGKTASTAYPGNLGDIAYTHAYTNKGNEFKSGLYKITTNKEGHVTAATTVTKADITALGLPAYATCATAADKPNKEISIPNFTLSTGTTIRVKFTNKNSAASPCLVINGDTNNSKFIKLYNSTAAGASDTTSGWRAGAIVPLTYDGTQWIRDYWENTIYTGIPSGGSAGNLLLWKSSGTAQWGTINYAGSSSAGGAANSANKLNTNAGSTSVPVYFKNGIPEECTEIGSTMLQENTTASSATNTITIPTEIKNNISSGSLFQVYHNGVLLNNPTNYTIKSDNSAIILTYNCLINDIFTFTVVSKVVKTLDTTLYLRKSDAASTYLSLTAAQNYALKKDCLPLAGGIMTGPIDMSKQNINNCNSITATTITASGKITGNQVYGAVWNDYAEYRIADTIEPGTVVCENGDDTMSVSKERMQPGAAIVSDTFGFAIGETDKAKTPIAVSGRVLAKPYEPIEEFKKAIGRPVCAGPNGTVSIMTDEEYATKGYCAIGTVSAVPDYTIWGDGIKVNNRIWIKVG